MDNGMKPLVVTTEHRGVFFGYGVPSDAPTIRLERVQMCMYWEKRVRGVLGLAVTGPIGQSRVGPAAPAMTLRSVSGVIEATKEAESQWLKSK